MCVEGYTPELIKGNCIVFWIICSQYRFVVKTARLIGAFVTNCSSPSKSPRSDQNQSCTAKEIACQPVTGCMAFSCTYFHQYAICNPTPIVLQFTFHSQYTVWVVESESNDAFPSVIGLVFGKSYIYIEKK